MWLQREAEKKERTDLLPKFKVQETADTLGKELNLMKKMVRVNETDSGISAFGLDKIQKQKTDGKQNPSPLYSKTTNVHDEKNFKPQSIHGFDSNDDEDYESEDDELEQEISKLTALHEGGSKDKKLNKPPSKQKPLKEEKKTVQGLPNINPKVNKNQSGISNSNKSKVQPIQEKPQKFKKVESSEDDDEFESEDEEEEEESELDISKELEQFQTNNPKANISNSDIDKMIDEEMEELKKKKDKKKEFNDNFDFSDEAALKHLIGISKEGQQWIWNKCIDMYVESKSSKYHYVDPEFKEHSRFADDIKLENEINQKEYPFKDYFKEEEPDFSSSKLYEDYKMSHFEPHCPIKNLKYEVPPCRADFQLSMWRIDSYGAVKS